MASSPGLSASITLPLLLPPLPCSPQHSALLLHLNLHPHLTPRASPMGWCWVVTLNSLFPWVTAAHVCKGAKVRVPNLVPSLSPPTLTQLPCESCPLPYLSSLSPVPFAWGQSSPASKESQRGPTQTSFRNCNNAHLVLQQTHFLLLGEQGLETRDLRLGN